MDIIILSTILFIAIVIMVYIPTKKVSKAIGYAILIYVSIQIILGFIIYLDAMQLKDRFLIEEKTILLEHHQNYIAGFKGNNMENPEDILFFNDEQINSYQGQNYQESLRNSYKLMIIKSETFNNLETIKFNQQTFSKEELFLLLESDNTIEDLANKFLEEQKAKQLNQYSEEFLPQIELQLEEQKNELVSQFKTQLNIKDNTQLKGLIFALLLSESMKKDQLTLIKGLQKNKIIIYPETSTIIFIKLIPVYLIDVIQENLSKFIQ